MKLSNDVEKYEIEVTKIGQNNHSFLQCNNRPVKVNFFSFRQLGEPIMLQVQAAGCTSVQPQALNCMRILI